MLLCVGVDNNTFIFNSTTHILVLSTTALYSLIQSTAVVDLAV